ncbi:MAG: hypothetical protein AAF514_11005, partial [Verrucomicrobiota bacterium]
MAATSVALPSVKAQESINGGSLGSEKRAKTSVVWQKEPLCQFVFFAVLEGLYRDGVQNEIVDLIIGETEKAATDGVKRSFVFQCELCHATFEAFRTYRGRPSFLNSAGQTSFGKGVSPDIIRDLKGDARSRVYAMGSLVRPWIMERVKNTRKTAEEKEAMRMRFKEYADEGSRLLDDLRAKKDPFYLDWQFYGSC